MKKALICFLVFLIFAVESSSKKIKVLKGIPNDYAQTQSTQDSTEVNKKEETCKNILNTHQSIGKDTLSVYSKCSLPFDEGNSCLDNISNLFCNFYLTNSDTKFCGHPDLKNFIFNQLNKCFNPPESTKDKYTCPELNLETFKVEDPLEFCIASVSKVFKENKDEKNKYKQTKVKSIAYDACVEIVNEYNFCIEINNSLYPEESYDECFKTTNALYDCNIINEYSAEEKEQCKKQILPTIATLTFKDREQLYDEDRFCSDIEKIIQDNEADIDPEQLNALIKYIQEKNQEIQDNISVLTMSWAYLFGLKGIDYDKLGKDLQEYYKLSTELEEYGLVLSERIHLAEKLPEIKDIIEKIDQIQTDIYEDFTRDSESREVPKDIDSKEDRNLFESSLNKNKNFLKIAMDVLSVGANLDKKEVIGSNTKINKYKTDILKVVSEKEDLE